MAAILVAIAVCLGMLVVLLWVGMIAAAVLGEVLNTVVAAAQASFWWLWQWIRGQ